LFFGNGPYDPYGGVHGPYAILFSGKQLMLIQRYSNWRESSVYDPIP
jgi:hypothetical protein